MASSSSDAARGAVVPVAGLVVPDDPVVGAGRPRGSGASARAGGRRRLAPQRHPPARRNVGGGARLQPHPAVVVDAVRQGDASQRHPLQPEPGAGRRDAAPPRPPTRRDSGGTRAVPTRRAARCAAASGQKRHGLAWGRSGCLRPMRVSNIAVELGAPAPAGQAGAIGAVHGGRRRRGTRCDAGLLQAQRPARRPPSGPGWRRSRPPPGSRRARARGCRCRRRCPSGRAAGPAARREDLQHALVPPLEDGQAPEILGGGRMAPSTAQRLPAGWAVEVPLEEVGATCMSSSTRTSRRPGGGQDAAVPGGGGAGVGLRLEAQR